MKSPWVKLAPTLVVMAAAITLVWPHANAPDKFISGKVKVSTLDGTLLASNFTASTARDPFRTPQQERAAAKEAAATVATAAKSSTIGAKSDGAPKAKPIAELAKIDPKHEAISKLSLGAISIRGSRRIAVIDGRVYEEGEPLERPHSDLDPVVVTAVHADKVLLRSEAGDVTLRFPDGSASRSGTPAIPRNAVASASPPKRPDSRITPRNGRPR